MIYLHRTGTANDLTKGMEQLQVSLNLGWFPTTKPYVPYFTSALMRKDMTEYLSLTNVKWSQILIWACVGKNCIWWGEHCDGFNAEKHEYFFISMQTEDFPRLTWRSSWSSITLITQCRICYKWKRSNFWSTERPCFAWSPVGLGNRVLLCAGKMLSRKCFSCFKNYTQGFL